MAFDLPLGFRHEPEAHAIAEQSREGADREGSRIPERIEHAGARRRALSAGSRTRPGGRSSSRRHGAEFAYFVAPREQGLRVVEGLGGYLAGMIHPHQGRGFAPLGSAKRGVGRLAGRGCAARAGGEQGPRGAIRLAEINPGRAQRGMDSIIYGGGGPSGASAASGVCFAKPASLQYTSAPFFRAHPDGRISRAGSPDGWSSSDEDGFCQARHGARRLVRRGCRRTRRSAVSHADRHAPQGQAQGRSSARTSTWAITSSC